ncbi:MAG: hypothetical protein GY791_08570 [Alphaproteobacteria bacterium]|nr:hypothetical protein [Alphaproteobacteria bacterium]
MIEPQIVIAALLKAALAISPAAQYSETFLRGAPFVVCAAESPEDGRLFDAGGIDGRVLCRSIDWSCFRSDGVVIPIIDRPVDD